MSAPKYNEDREERIRMNILEEHDEPGEVAFHWHGYLEGTLSFPFRARCTQTRIISVLAEDEEVEVVEITSGEECVAEMFVTVRWNDRKIAVPLMQLEPIDANPESNEAIADWHYWIGQGYRIVN